MLKIYICEDSDKQRENFERIISNIILIENYDMELTLSHEDPYEILSYIKSENSPGIYFIDVDLNSDINGIEVAERIRKHDSSGFIIFVTTHAEMSYLTFQYKVEAMDYIIKDNYKNIQSRIYDCLKNINDKYISSSSPSSNMFSIKSNDKIINISFDEILFFETASTIHKIILHGENRQVEFYGKMKEVEAMLDNRFVRCHNSFIVNKDKITEIDKKSRTAKMSNGEECLVSIRALNKLV